MDSWKEISEILRNLAQPIAVFGAGLFFYFRLRRGWIYSNLTLDSSVSRSRQAGDSMRENAVVSLSLQKGDRANASLESIVVRAFDVNDLEQAIASRSVNIRHPSQKTNLNLPPGEVAKFELHFEIEQVTSVLFETTVKANGPAWKTTVVSIPIEQ